MQFYDFRHAAMRLDHSVVRLDDIPIYIEQVECSNDHFQANDCMISYSVVGDPRKCKHYTTLYNPHLNLTPVPLGLVNLVGDVFAVGRLPQRQWKVGLTTTNIHVRKMSMGQQFFMNKQDMLRSSELKHTILDEYPSVAEILAGSKHASGRSLVTSGSWATC